MNGEVSNVGERDYLLLPVRSAHHSIHVTWPYTLQANGLNGGMNGHMVQSESRNPFGENPTCVHDAYEVHARSKKSTDPVSISSHACNHSLAWGHRPSNQASLLVIVRTDNI